MPADFVERVCVYVSAVNYARLLMANVSEHLTGNLHCIHSPFLWAD